MTDRDTSLEESKIELDELISLGSSISSEPNKIEDTTALTIRKLRPRYIDLDAFAKAHDYSSEQLNGYYIKKPNQESFNAHAVSRAEAQKELESGNQAFAIIAMNEKGSTSPSTYVLANVQGGKTEYVFSQSEVNANKLSNEISFYGSYAQNVSPEFYKEVMSRETLSQEHKELIIMSKAQSNQIDESYDTNKINIIGIGEDHGSAYSAIFASSAQEHIAKRISEGTFAVKSAAIESDHTLQPQLATNRISVADAPMSLLVVDQLKEISEGKLPKDFKIKYVDVDYSKYKGKSLNGTQAMNERDKFMTDQIVDLARYGDVEFHTGNNHLILGVAIEENNPDINFIAINTAGENNLIPENQQHLLHRSDYASSTDVIQTIPEGTLTPSSQSYQLTRNMSIQDGLDLGEQIYQEQEKIDNDISNRLQQHGQGRGRN